MFRLCSRHGRLTARCRTGGGGIFPRQARGAEAGQKGEAERRSAAAPSSWHRLVELRRPEITSAVPQMLKQPLERVPMNLVGPAALIHVRCELIAVCLAGVEIVEFGPAASDGIPEMGIAN